MLTNFHWRNGMYLYILVSLVLALIFAFSCHTAIRRHPGIFYGIAFFLVLSEVIYYQFGIHDIAPQWFTAYIVNPFKRGAFSTALFIIVMYLGALDSKHLFVRKLMGIRGQLCLLACILARVHTRIQCTRHVTHRITAHGTQNPLCEKAFCQSVYKSLGDEASNLARRCSLNSNDLHYASLDDDVFPICSPQNVCRQLEKTAAAGLPVLCSDVYSCYGTVHPQLGEKIPDIIAYTVIFGTYLILRVAKATKKSSRTLGYAGCNPIF